MTLIQMADSVDLAEIPRLYAAWDNGIATYRDGPHAYTPAELAPWPRGWRITVNADPAVAIAARAIDCEHLDATPQAIQPYQEARGKYGAQTTVYTSLSQVRAIQDADDLWHELLWWLAWWVPSPPTVADTLAEAEAYGALPIDPAMVRAIQWSPRGTYDSSMIFGDPQWQHFH